MRLLDRAPVLNGRRGFLRLACFRFLFLSGILGTVARLSGWQQVRAALYACIHRGPSGRCRVRVVSMEACPDLTCAVRGAWVPWIPSTQAAVFPCTIAAPRHRALHCTAPYATLPYHDRTYRTLPACPCTMPIHLCVSLTCPVSLCFCLSVIVG
jgi:hypothetical protein